MANSQYTGTIQGYEVQQRWFILHARDIPKPTRFRETSGRRPAVVGACTYKLINVGDKIVLTKDDNSVHHFSDVVKG
ncbi:hypothetical protein BDN67DRAFT_90007 [Paxillus ammoniavirescens]|nr:hypothetical protein BDN67DRAFT_90007 [Paxillus ammoniavirescens]